MSLKKLLIMAGGTGGHIFPALAIAQQLQKQGVQIAWLGSTQGLENEIVPKHHIPLHLISIRGLRGKGWRRWLQAPFAIIQAIFAARRLIKEINPDAVLGMGGFASGPGAIAAKLLKKPLFIHEQNAAAGLTNRILARLAQGVFQAFPNTFPPKLHPYTTGNPVREQLAMIPPPSMRFVGASKELINILVLGGSQGALILNQTMPLVLKQFSAKVAVWHQTGKQSLAETQAAYANVLSEARVESFVEDMAAAFKWADLVICRAGALTVAELATVGIGSILIPFPLAVDDHQTRNAEYLVKHEAAILLPQSQLNVASLSAILQQLVDSPERLQRMAQFARELSMASALERVSTLCQELYDRESSYS